MPYGVYPPDVRLHTLATPAPAPVKGSIEYQPETASGSARSPITAGLTSHTEAPQPRSGQRLHQEKT